LLIVATTVWGGTFVFIFTQDFINDAQISGSPNVELIKIIGYDARDLTEITAHNGNVMAVGTAGDPSVLGKNVDERVAIHINNLNIREVLLTEIRLGGTVYEYDTSIKPLGAWDDVVNLVPGKYFIMRDSTTIIQEPVPLIQSGQFVTILIDLEDSFPIGRDIQFKLTTASGAVFMSTDLPAWIKNNADWWAKGLISDSEFATGIAYMIKGNIIQVENVKVDSKEAIIIDKEISIPKWIQINALWWADDEISDSDFIFGIQFLLEEEIISFKEKPQVISSEIYINM